MSQPAPIVSVVIPAFNAAGSVADAVRSALASGDVPVEVLAVDDGSTDGTGAILAALAADPRVHVLRHPGSANRGVAASRNLAVRHARAALVAFLDADDAWVAGSLAARLEALATAPDAVLAYGRVEVIDDGGGTGERWGEGTAGASSLLPWLLFENPVPLSTVLVRREALAEPAFPEGLEVQIEDWLAWLGVAARGPFAFVDRPLARYRLAPGSWTAGLDEPPRRHAQLVDEAQELAGRIPGLPPSLRHSARAAVAYRAAILLVEAAGALARARPGRARLPLAAARRAAGSAAMLVRALGWVPRLKWHAWTRPPRPSPAALRYRGPVRR